MNDFKYLAIKDVDPLICSYLSPQSMLTMTEVNTHYADVLQQQQTEFNDIKYSFERIYCKGYLWLLKWLYQHNNYMVVGTFYHRYLNDAIAASHLEMAHWLLCQKRLFRRATKKNFDQTMRLLIKSDCSEEHIKMILDIIICDYGYEIDAVEEYINTICQHGQIGLVEYFIEKEAERSKKYLRDRFCDIFEDKYKDHVFVRRLTEIVIKHQIFKPEEIKKKLLSHVRRNCNLIPAIIALEDIYGKIDIHSSNEVLFLRACLNGKTDLVLFLLNLEDTRGQIDIHAKHEEAFQSACRHGYLDLLKLLLSLEDTHGQIDIHAKNEKAFRSACDIGKTDIIEFLLSLEATHGQIDIHADKECAFWTACEKSISTVKLLLELEATHGQIDIHAKGEKAFQIACRKNKLDIIKLLLSLEATHGQINIHAGNEYAFKYACKNLSIQVTKFLLELQPTHGEINTDVAVRTCSKDVLIWLDKYFKIKYDS